MTKPTKMLSDQLHGIYSLGQGRWIFSSHYRWIFYIYTEPLGRFRMIHHCSPDTSVVSDYSPQLVTHRFIYYSQNLSLKNGY